MNIALLSFGVGWHVRDLMRAAAECGHRTETLEFRRIYSILPNRSRRDQPGGSQGDATVLQDSLSPFDAVIVRTMPPGSLEQVVFRMDLLHRFQAEGGMVVNPPQALETCIDKYLASARLAAANLPVPPTMVCQDAESAMEGFHSLGRDVVVKPLFGSEGRGMMRIENADLAWRTFRTLERTGAVLYLQQFVHHPGWDLRGFVIGGKVVASMRRHAKDDWRTNVAQGGKAEAVSLTAEEEELVIRSAQVVGAPVAGVDLLPRPEGGYYVLEVNAVPGWRALAPVTGIDIAAAIIRYLDHLSSTLIG